MSGHHLLGADRLPRCRPTGTLALAPASSPGAADRVRTPRDTKAGPRRNIADDLLLARNATDEFRLGSAGGEFPASEAS